MYIVSRFEYCGQHCQCCFSGLGIGCSNYGWGQYRIEPQVRAYNSANIVRFHYFISGIISLSTVNDSGVYAALLISHAAICTLTVKVIARLQRLYIVINILCVEPLFNHNLYLIISIPS